ncbi:50S ribosomal protein L7/L12 [Ehrlichia ruminantium]|uniref:Large ribosomal subunit protein bL12 n=1 Tax=Ehrlichia ruminantium TaxID=779 RepID=A0AAE6UJC7_EHRRU|nr:50S ribosomal protein L7/L12 [Ehrlichia ruminantium]QGR02254.1 50S ribosomal protein L7/L12 [Ehrlichia ruminantium]QGR03176.1 50S ribosomal protein L7/L12 [Ehrlichia ruminantium]QGR04101.1 50S ribosomal protein L7/L12 [Ehrlichia ruminantium]
MSNIDIDSLVDQICSLDLCKAAELVDKMEQKLGFPKGGLLTAVPATGGSQAESVVEEKTEFSVIFDSYAADKKISVIKAVRECTSLGLKEAKEFVEKEGAKELVEGKKYKKEEAEEIKKKLEDAGAKVTIK